MPRFADIHPEIKLDKVYRITWLMWTKKQWQTGGPNGVWSAALSHRLFCAATESEVVQHYLHFLHIYLNTVTPGPRKAKKKAAERAREGRAHARLDLLEVPAPNTSPVEPNHAVVDNGYELEGQWDGTMLCVPSDSEDSDGGWVDFEDGAERDSDDNADLEDLTGEELVEGLRM